MDFLLLSFLALRFSSCICSLLPGPRSILHFTQVRTSLLPPALTSQEINITQLEGILFEDFRSSSPLEGRRRCNKNELRLAWPFTENVYFFLYAYLSICILQSVSPCLSAFLRLYLSIYLCVCVRASACLFVCLSAGLSACLSACL